MLAASSTDHNREPAPFRVALRILIDERRLPEKLAAYLQTVVAQAVQIVNDPTVIDADTLPEAIELAVGIQESASLRGALDTLAKGAVTPATARDMLAAERNFAAAR